MLDDILSKSKERVRVVHEVAAKHSINVWTPLITLLNREDPVIVHMASRLIGKFASLSKVYFCQSFISVDHDDTEWQNISHVIS